MPHDSRREAYMGVRDELALLALDMAKRGIRQPLVITQEGVVVSGHRRLAAARLAGLAEVPCVVQDDADDAKMAVEMTLDNAPRKRPFTQLMAHALVLKDIVEPILRARERHEDPSTLPGHAFVVPIIDMMTGGPVTKGTGVEQQFAPVTKGTEGSCVTIGTQPRQLEGGCVNKITQPQEGGSASNDAVLRWLRWEDVVSRLIGMSGSTLRRGLEIYQAALDGDEHAEDLCMKLDEGELTITGAYKAVKASRMPSAARDFVVLRLHGNMRSRVQRTGPRPRPGHRHYATLG